jgi:hypothetical protein
LTRDKPAAVVVFQGAIYGLARASQFVAARDPK